MMIMMDLQTRGESVSAFSIFSGDASSFPYSSAGRSPPLHPSARAGTCSAALAYPVLMTFSKLSRGGRVCGAGSRGQAEMLQQIYSRGGGWNRGARQRESRDPHTSQNASSLAKPKLNSLLPPRRGGGVCFCWGSSLQGGWGGESGLLGLLAAGRGVGPVGAPRCREGGRACWGSSDSSRQSETDPLKDESSGALTRDMLCVRK